LIRKIAVYSFMMVSLAQAGAAPLTTHPIIATEQACICRDGSTAGMIECNSKALKAWDQELNKVYQQLLTDIDKEEKQAATEKDHYKQEIIHKVRVSLIKSQRAWLKFRDQEQEFIVAYYDFEDGTIWPLERGNMVKEITISRVRDLYRLLRSKDMAGESYKNYTFDTP
jgi:uncharacterized protein YecT (DUF1311 family)